MVKSKTVWNLPLAVLLCVLLAACGGAIATRQVFDRLERAGLATNARAADTDARCGEQLQFDIPGAPVGAFGIVVVCSQEPRWSMTALDNASFYRSAGGSISVLVSGAPEIAPRIGEQVQQMQE